MGKLIKQAGESAKVAVRTARQAAVKQAKALPGKDDQKRAEKQVTPAPVPLVMLLCAYLMTKHPSAELSLCDCRSRQSQISSLGTLTRPVKANRRN